MRHARPQPLLVGLNNPHSRRARDALLPWPRGCTGHRIVEMIRLVEPSFTDDDYVDSFARRNLWPGSELPEGPGSMKLYQRHGRELLRDVESEPRDVVLFGTIAWYATLGRNVPPKFESREKAGSTFWYVPHPSGLCRVYNKPENRLAAGVVLLSLVRQRVVLRRVV